MSKSFLLALILFIIGAEVCAYGMESTSLDVQIQVVHTNGPPGPAQQVGFDTLAFNGDFGQGMDLGCYPDDGNAHQWYQGIWYAFPTVPCSRINLVQDGGQQVADLTWLSTDNAQYGATVLSTINHYGRQVTDFPNGYYEAIFRVQMTPNTTGIGGGWWNAWMWGTQSVVNSVNNPGCVGGCNPVVEYDIMETHSEFPTFLTSGCINWGLGGPGHGCGYASNQFVGGFDYRTYHKYAMQIMGDGTQRVACFFLDDAFEGCANASASGAELTQRSFLLLSVGWGCNFTNGYGNCQNLPIDNVYSCPAPYSGQICLHFNPNSTFNALAYQTNNPLATITGVVGVPGANGTFSVTSLQTYPAPATDWVLLGTTFSGSYTSGTGTFNQYTKLDMYVKSFRVWSCANWQTTMCNGAIIQSF